MGKTKKTDLIPNLPDQSFSRYDFDSTGEKSRCRGVVRRQATAPSDGRCQRRLGAVETIMGDLFKPDSVLRNYAGRLQFKRYGWEPSSARFKDRITETYANVLIDHILAT